MIANQITPSELETQLNLEVNSKSGRLFTPSDDVWSLDETSRERLYVSKSAEVVPTELRLYYRLALSRYAQTHAPDTVKGVVATMLMCNNLVDRRVNILNEEDFLILKAKMSAVQEYKMAIIRGFLKYWIYEARIFGPSLGYIKTLEKLRIKGNVQRQLG